jgi:hypothetical protein
MSGAICSFSDTMHFPCKLCNFVDRSSTVWAFGDLSVYIAYPTSQLNTLISLFYTGVFIDPS